MLATLPSPRLDFRAGEYTPCAREGEECAKADAARARLFGLSAFVFEFTARLEVEAFFCDARVVLEALEMESRILWNFLLVVLSATDMVNLRCGRATTGDNASVTANKTIQAIRC